MLRSLIKRSVYNAAATFHLNDVLLRLGDRKLLVLCYHGVVPGDSQRDEFLYRNAVSAAEFARQIQWISSRRRPVCLEEVADHYAGRRPLHDRCVLITFDDGYRNNLEIAAPILQEAGVPAAIAVSTGYIGQTQMLWADEVNLRVYFWRGRNLPLPAGSTSSSVVNPTDPELRMKVASSVRQVLKTLDESARDAYLSELRNGRCTEVDNADADLFAFLTWSQVRHLANLGFSIASHTVTHPILSRISANAVQSELAESKERIEFETGSKCLAIVYPNGQAADITPDVLNIAERTGYELGFTLRNTHASLTGSALTVDRVNVPGQQSLAVFQSCTSGLRQLIAAHQN